MLFRSEPAHPLRVPRGDQHPDVRAVAVPDEVDRPQPQHIEERERVLGHRLVTGRAIDIRGAAVAAALLVSPASADWPRFRGPNGGGIAADTANDPLAHIAAQVQEQVPYAVFVFRVTKPDLLFGELGNTGVNTTQ